MSDRDAFKCRCHGGRESASLLDAPICLAATPPKMLAWRGRARNGQLAMAPAALFRCCVSFRGAEDHQHARDKPLSAGPVATRLRGGVGSATAGMAAQLQQAIMTQPPRRNGVRTWRRFRSDDVVYRLTVATPGEPARRSSPRQHKALPTNGWCRCCVVGGMVMPRALVCHRVTREPACSAIAAA